MYAEAAGKVAGASATLSSPWMTLSTECKLRFSYFLYGDKPGTLYLNNTSSYGGSTRVWNSTNSATSSHWQTEEVMLGRGYASKIVFQAVMDGEDSDIAIDDIQLVNCGGNILQSYNF